jgi:branched-chain amino acid transport system substrate-binding protein
MLHISRRLLIGSVSAMGLTLMAGSALAQSKYDTGASDTEIKIGNTMPYSGPASAYGVIGKTVEAYFKKVNDEGGVNKRKITFITYDDGYSPPKTKEMVRKLVEEDKVLLLFNTLGTPSNTMIWDYLNEEKVPQLFVATGASKWGDFKGHPWTMGFQPDYQTEATIYAKHILANHPNAKIGVLYQNDDYGKDYLAGFKRGLDKNVGKIVKEVSYEVADPTVDSQIIQLKDSGADVFFNITTPKFAAQAIKKAADLGWKPTQYLNNVSSSVGSVMKPAGLDASQGLITALYLKDPTDKQWESSKDFQDWKTFMAKYMPSGDLSNGNHVFGYAVANLMVQVLKQAGDDLTRANIMKQAANIKGLELPLLLPGIKINTSATDFYPIQSVQLARFKGDTWERFGEVLSNEAASQ